MARGAISGLMHRSKNSKTLLSCAGSTHQTRVSGLRDTNDTNSMTGNIGTIPIAHTMSALPHERPVTLTKQENSNAQGQFDWEFTCLLPQPRKTTRNGLSPRNDARRGSRGL